MLNRFLTSALLVPFLATVSTATPGRTEPSPTGPFASVEHADYHQLVFANNDISILDILVPPHRQSVYHEHKYERFYVVVAAARIGTQEPGKPLRTPPVAPKGSVGFNGLTAAVFVHRIVNDDDKPYHVIGIEIRRPAPVGTPASQHSEADGYVQVFDNTRVRAWRVTLAPGQQTKPITQLAVGVRVVVRGGLLQTLRPALPDQTQVIENGAFGEQSAGETRSLRNAGKTPIELVEIELK